MVSNRQRARKDAPQSVFPAAEPPSFCSRPTPVVPADPDLCGDEPSGLRDSARPPAPPAASVSISDRPTYVPDEYVEPRLEAPPSLTIEETAWEGDSLEPLSNAGAAIVAVPQVAVPRRPVTPDPVAAVGNTPEPDGLSAADAAALLPTLPPAQAAPPLAVVPALIALPTVHVRQDTTLPPRARGPRAWSRLLFVVLFGSVISLLGYAFKPELAHAWVNLGSSAHATVGNK